MKTRRLIQILSEKQIKQVALEYGKIKGAEQLADEFGVSRQRVEQVAGHLRKAGVKIPWIRKKKYMRIVEELKREHPELFSE